MSHHDQDSDQNEGSPLMRSENGSIDEGSVDIEHQRLSHSSDDSGHDFKLQDSIVESKSTLYLIFLTLSIGGLQIVWSVELSNGSPYLLSLGMSKALLAFVWLAGPLTGVLVQPYIGILSDRCRVSWGRRKPFMIAGTLGTVMASLLLAYAKQIVRVLGRWDVNDPYDGHWRDITIIFATVMMWVLDFAINTVQAAIRAFIVDGAPAHQQESANAWASRIVGVGNVLGYVFGFLNLPRVFWFLGREQFQVLCSIASITITSTVFISILVIRERNPQDEPKSRSNYDRPGIIAFFKGVFVSIRRLPPPIWSVCEIQFFQWIGWFPFLFYITTYIGQLYVNPRINPSMSAEEVDQIWAKATRVGTFALLVYAIVSFSCNILLPFLIVPTYKPVAPLAANSDDIEPTSPVTPSFMRHANPSYSDLAQSTGHLSTFSGNLGINTELAPSATQRFLERLRVPGLTLRWAWLLSQLLFSLCMFSTFFISSPTVATIMVAIVGISWSLTLWAPFALISAEIARRDEARRRRQRQNLLGSGSLRGDADNDRSDYLGGRGRADGKEEDEEEDEAGIILGLHNVAVSAPQVIATLISSAIFKWLQKPRNVPGDTSVAWTLRLGGIAALVSAYYTWRMRESTSVEEDVKR